MIRRRCSAPKPRRKSTSHTRAELMTEVRRLKKELARHRTESSQAGRSQTTSVLQESLERYTHLHDLAPVTFLTLNSDGCVCEISLHGAQMLGRDRREIINRPFLPLVAEGDRRKFLGHLSCLRRGRAHASTEVAIATKDGRELVVQMITTAGGRSHASHRRFSTVLMDVTERKEAESRLEAARTAAEMEQSRLEAVMDVLPVGVAIIDERGGRIRSNRLFDEVWGGEPPPAHSVEDYAVYKAWWADTGRPVEPEEWASAIAVGKGETVVGQLFEIQRFDGKRAFVMNSAAPILDADGRIIGSAVAIFDVTERKHAEGALRETRDYLENLFNYANAPIIVWDPAFRITRFNRAFERLTGRAAEEVVGQSLEILFPEALREQSMAHIRRAASGERWEVVEIPILRVDGAVRMVLWNSATLYAPGGTRVVATIAQGQDITERKRAEEQLSETRDYLDNLLNYANAPVIVWDPEFRITRFNRAFERLTGRAAEEVVGQSLEILFPEALREQSMAHIRRAASGERWEVVEIPILRVDGAVRTVLWNSATLYAPDDKRPVATIAQGQDITERKLAEEALRRSNKRLEILSETAARLLAAEDPQPIVNSLCREVMTFLDCQAFFNFLVVEEEGRLRLNTYAGIPEEAARQIEWLDFGTAVCGCAARDACRIVAENIAETPDPRTDLVRSFGIQAYACHPLMSQNKVIGTLSFGTRTRSRFTDEDLEVMRAVADQVAIAMERKWGMTTLRRTAAELARSNEDLDQFASVASHDLQEPLRTVGGFVQLLQKEYQGKLGAQADEYITFAVEGVARMQALIKDLLAYARVSTRGATPGMVRAGDALEHALASMAVAVGESDAVITQDEMPVVCADVSQLSQLFQNLIGNAVKFRRPGVRPEIHVGAARRSDGWLFSVRDNGIGIAREYFGRLFQIFRRLHGQEEYPGTGVGLAICKRIVERHGGSIWIDSEPGQGTTFYFTIPDKPASSPAIADALGPDD